MAYDPEARRQSNSALIIGLVGLLIAGGAALAYFATRHNEPETTATTVVQGRDRIIVAPTSAPGPVVVVTSAPSTVVVPVPVPGTTIVKPGTNTTVTRNTTITRDIHTTVPAAPTAAPRTGASGGGSTPNITINNNNTAPTSAPAPRTSASGGTGTGGAGTGTSTSANSAAGDATTTNSATGTTGGTGGY